MGACVKQKSTAPITDPAVTSFLANVKPLDLIVFRGGDFVSNVIRKMEGHQTGRDDISHVEMAITREWCSKIKPVHLILDHDNNILSWGSTLSGRLNDGVTNLETGTATFGVQIRSLHDLVTASLRDPAANVGICHLLTNPTVRRPGEPEENYNVRVKLVKWQLATAYEKYMGRTYDANPISLFAAMFPELRPVRDVVTDSDWLFCSELIALIYETIGIISPNVDARNVLPVDFLGGDEDGMTRVCSEPIWFKKTITQGKFIM